MKLKNDIGLVGDFLGTIPVMIQMAEKEHSEGGFFESSINQEIAELFHMIPTKYRIGRNYVMNDFDKQLDLERAFQIASKENLHMTQAHFAVMGMTVPDHPIKPEIQYSMNITGTVQYDYVIAPFSRSLPEEQKWQRHKWQDLVDEIPNKRFCIIGAYEADKEFLDERTKNLDILYGKGWNYISCLLRLSGGLISIVSGPSHLAYALNVKNFLLTNQTGAWGNNPEAIKITKNIHDITVKDVVKILKEHE